MTAVTWALFSAACYGLADFLGGVGGRRASPWAVAALMQLMAGTLMLLAALVWWREPRLSDLGWGAAAALANGVGTGFLYRGLSRGRMGVVAPLAGVGTAAVPVLVGAVSGERPGLWVWVGIACALPAIWLVAGGGNDDPHRGPSGAGDGVAAGLGFGLLLSAIGQLSPGAGLLPLALIQLLAAVVVVLVALVLGEDWLPTRSAVLPAATSGALNTASTVAFATATQVGLLTVTSVLTAMYPAVTVILATTLLREQIHRSQAFGLALCAATVTLVALG